MPDDAVSKIAQRHVARIGRQGRRLRTADFGRRHDRPQPLPREVDGQRFEGIDLFLAEPHTPIDAGDDEIKALANVAASHDLAIGSCVAPVWPPVGGGAAIGSAEERAQFLEMVRKSCAIAQRLDDIGIRKSGVVRIDTASGVAEWAADPAESKKRITETFTEACNIAEGHGQRLAAEGEICWGGMPLLEAHGGYA